MAFVRLKIRVSLVCLVWAVIITVMRKNMWLDIGFWAVAVCVSLLAAWHVQQVWRGCRRYGVNFWRLLIRGKP
jgi:hypothetical protein